jgi:chorismate-pyruvate lyase
MPPTVEHCPCGFGQHAWGEWLTDSTARRVAPEDLPARYQHLLLHTGSMTARLEAYVGAAVRLQVLGNRCADGWYSRCALLVHDQPEVSRPIEFGAIRLRMDRFAPTVQEQVFRAELPLGKILSWHTEGYRTVPKMFLEVTPSATLAQCLKVQPGVPLFGREVDLLHDDRAKGSILEILTTL